MIRTLADQYLAQNAGRRYPFADDCDAQDIPDSAILDFRCTLRGVSAATTPRAWLTKVEAVFPAKRLTVTTVRPGTPDTSDTLVFDIPSDMAANAPYTVHAYDAATGAEGCLTVSASVLSVRNGAKSVPFAWTTVVCDSLKVHSIQSVQDADDARDKDDPAGLDAAAAVSGEIVLAEGRNAEPYLDGNRLRLDVFKGAGLGERCQSAVSGSQRCGTVLFTINGERPGSDGDIRIVGDGGIAVTPDPESHAVEIRMDDEATRRMADGCTTACPAYTTTETAETAETDDTEEAK